MFEMEAVWNHVHLERPPNATWQVKGRRFDTKAFLVTLDKIIKDLDSQEALHTEAAILSRLIYRMKSKFRNDKGLKSMSKVNRALLKYLSLSLEKEYKNLRSYVDIEQEYVSLPSRQMLEYILVRTQGFAMLMSRVEEAARHSAHFFKSRMNLGHAWSIAIVAYAIISRIWILSRHLIKKCCSWYNELYQYLEEFEVLGVCWLPKNYELPDDLKSWLALPWIDEAILSVPSNEQLKETMFKLITPQECDSDEDILSDIKGYANKSELEESKNRDKCVIPIDDTGEVVSRHSFDLKHTEIKGHALATGKRKSKYTPDQEEKHKKMRPEPREKKEREQTTSKSLMKKSVPEKSLTFDNVTTESDLTILLNKESYPGLDKLRWNMIKNKSEKLLNELSACSDGKVHSALLKKAIRRIRRWVS